MMSNAVVQALTNCQVHFALMGSDFDLEGKKKVVIKGIRNSQDIFTIWHIDLQTTYSISYSLCPMS